MGGASGETPKVKEEGRVPGTQMERVVEIRPP